MARKDGKMLGFVIKWQFQWKLSIQSFCISLMNSPYGGDKTFFSIKKREIICKLGISILIHDIIVIKTAIKSTHTKK